MDPNTEERLWFVVRRYTEAAKVISRKPKPLMEADGGIFFIEHRRFPTLA
jgi:hypothetical protein